MFYQKFYKKAVNIGPRALLYTTILIFSMFLSSAVPYSQLKFENKKKTWTEITGTTSKVSILISVEELLHECIK